MTCKHIDRAREKLTIFLGKIQNYNDKEFYEDSGPWVSEKEIKVSTGLFKIRLEAPDHFLRLVRKEIVEAKIKEIDNILISCSCYTDEKIGREGDNVQRENLIKSHQKEQKLFNSQLDDIKKTYKEMTDKQYDLIETERKETRMVRTENSQLQRTLGLSDGQVKQLELQLTDKTNELNLNKQALDRLRQAFLDLSVSNATNATRAEVVGEQLN